MRADVRWRRGQVLALRAQMEGGAAPRQFQLKDEIVAEAWACAEALRAALGQLSLKGEMEERGHPGGALLQRQEGRECPRGREGKKM